MELWNNIMTAWAEGEDAVSILEKTADLTDAIQDRLPFAFGGSAKKKNYSSYQQVIYSSYQQVIYIIYSSPEY